MPAVEERNFTKAAFALLTNDAPDKIVACKQLLRVICKRNKVISLHNDPLTHFINEQVYLTTLELLNKLENQLMSHKDIFDDCENICHLFTMLLPDNGPACVRFSASIHQITMAIAELSNLLERNAKARVVNWAEIGQSFITQAKEANALQSHNSFRNYIPSIADFDLINLVGTGTMSQVYSVIHRPTGHQFALKVTPRTKLPVFEKAGALQSTAPQDVSVAPNLITEARGVESPAMAFIDRVVGSMTHDLLVCRIHAVWVARPNLDVALIEYIEDDVDVMQVVDYLGYMATEDAMLVTFQTLLGIEHMHIRGFIHRDVKPSNLLIDKNGRVRLTDFVNAKICRGHFPTKKILTSYFRRTGQEFKDHETAGTAAYMAPEVLLKKSYGRASDWWALGVTMYKLTTGKVPFRGDEASVVKERIINDELRWPKIEENPHSATPEVKEFVYDLLKKNPIHRLGTKMYSDLKDHQAMAKAAAMLRRVQTIKESGEVRDARTKLYIIAHSEINRVVIKNMDQTVSAIIENRAPLGQSNLNFNDIQDLPLDKHYRLFTFAHPKFRRFIDRQSGTFQGSDKYLTVITPPEPDLDYTARDDGETLLEATRQETVAQRMSQIQLLDVFVNWPLRQCIFMSREIKFEIARGEGQITYPVVMKIRHESKQENPTEVIFGDIVVTIENVRLHAHGMRELYKTLDDLIKKKGTTRFHCQVFANNIFRFAHAHFNTALSIVTTKVPVELTLTAVKPMKGFMRTHVLKLWNPDTKEFVPNHVIISVSSQITVATGESIFYGDILATVNGKDTGVMSVAEVQRQLRSRIPIHVSIVQISVLRRKDLHEAGIGHEKYQELNLERMSVNI